MYEYFIDYEDDGNFKMVSIDADSYQDAEDKFKNKYSYSSINYIHINWERLECPQ